MLENSHDKSESAEIDRLDWLLQRARQGDIEVLPELRDWLKRSGVWRQAGDLGRQALAAWVKLIVGSDLALQESILMKLQSLQQELAPTPPTPVERLLIDRIVANWLQLHHAELAGTQAINVNKQRLSEFWSRRQSRAERAYVRSLAALVAVRRLLSAVRPPAAAAAQQDAPSFDSEAPVEDAIHLRPLRLRLVDQGAA